VTRKASQEATRDAEAFVAKYGLSKSAAAELAELLDKTWDLGFRDAESKAFLEKVARAAASMPEIEPE
jgi:hypothetical protein